MSEVKIKVGPRQYAIACDPSDEAKVRKFGALIDENYSKLGNARATQEADNMVFAALFMADELDEARKEISDSRAELTEVRNQLQKAQDDATNALHKATVQADQAREKSGSGKAELLAEIETLRQTEERTRKENDRLKTEVAALKESARHQHELFGGPANDAAHSDALGEKLEALAIRAEATASELEGKAGTH